jgi:hypothetical protein
VIRDHDELHAVLQGELRRFRRSGGRREGTDWFQAFQAGDHNNGRRTKKREDSQRGDEALLHGSDGPYGVRGAVASGGGGAPVPSKRGALRAGAAGAAGTAAFGRAGAGGGAPVPS